MDTIEEVLDYLECDCQHGYAKAVRELEDELTEAKAKFAQLEEEAERCCQRARVFEESNIVLLAENTELRLEIIAATGQAQTALEESVKPPFAGRETGDRVAKGMTPPFHDGRDIESYRTYPKESERLEEE